VSAEPQSAPVPALADLYEHALRERIRRLKKLRAHPEMLPAVRRYYRTHIADWINDWGVTIDPRNIRKGLPVVIPFLLDERQREWIDFTLDNWKHGRYGLTVKSRDVGVSWLIVALSIGLATLYDDLAVGWGSFKSDKVDRLGDMGSLFEKGRNYMEGLPLEFRGGYEARSCASLMRLLFPNTGGAILGEVGDNIGRGSRTAIYFVDEAAHLEHGEVVDAALSKTTDCRQDVSSVYGMNNTFAVRAHQKDVPRFDFHWRHNPRMTQRDYEDFLDTWGPVITAQELDMNFQASVEGIVIPALWVNAAVDAHLKLKIKPTGERLASLDVADTGRDKNAAAVRHGVLLEHVESFSGKESDIYATVERAFLICDSYGAIRKVRYDADGVGAGVRGDARKVNEKRNPAKLIAVEAFRGSAAVLDPTREMVEGRRNEDLFANFKAQAWWALRMRFQNTWRAVNGEPYEADDIISISSAIPEKAKLLIELSQPTYSQNLAGKLLIDKQPEGTPSPNLGDAVMMAYAPARKPLRIDESVLED